MTTETAGAYFERLDDHRVRATGHTGGAWRLDEQHIAPTLGLIVHEVERHATTQPARPALTVSRVTMEILGVLPIAEMDVAVEVLRPGRTIELVEATVSCAGRVAVRARLWRVAAGETAAVAGGAEAPMPALEATPEWPMAGVWPGGFVASLDVRRAPGAAPGRARAWVTSSLDLVAGEETGVLARWATYLDTANGVAVRQDPRRWMFPNLDLTAHLHRTPVAGPTGLDVSVVFGAGGLGVTSAVLHDVAGPVGRLAQTLTVRPLG